MGTVSTFVLRGGDCLAYCAISRSILEDDTFDPTKEIRTQWGHDPTEILGYVKRYLLQVESLPVMPQRGQVLLIDPATGGTQLARFPAYALAVGPERSIDILGAPEDLLEN